MEMSIDLVATLRGDQLDPTTTTKPDEQDWDVQEEAQCSEFFRDEKRMELLKTPLNRRKSKEDEMMHLLRNLSKRVSAIEKHLRIQEPDEKIPNSPKIQKSPVMRRRKYTPSASSRKQQQFGLSRFLTCLESNEDEVKRTSRIRCTLVDAEKSNHTVVDTVQQEEYQHYNN